MKYLAVCKKYSARIAAGAGLVFGAAVSAYAALPAAVGSTITATQSNASDIFDAVFPVIGTVIGFTLVIKLFKKFTNQI